MSIRPIDLQTLFVKMDELSKEQAHVKEQAALQQAQAAKEQVARELVEDRQVTETPEGNEVDPLKDDESGETEDQRRRERKKSKGQNETEAEERMVVIDPDVGRHVDLSG